MLQMYHAFGFAISSFSFSTQIFKINRFLDMFQERDINSENE